MPEPVPFGIASCSNPFLLATVCGVLLSGCARLQAVQDETPISAPRTYVYECEGGFRFIARSSGNTVWLFLPNQTIQLPHSDTGPEGRYRGRDITFLSVPVDAFLETPEQTYRRCRNNQTEAISEHARLKGIDFRAAGTTPDWHLELTLDAEITFVTLDDQTVYRFTTPTPDIDEAARITTYTAANPPNTLVLRLEAKPCIDDPSGDSFDVTVRVTLDHQAYHGCGRALH